MSAKIDATTVKPLSATVTEIDWTAPLPFETNWKDLFMFTNILQNTEKYFGADNWKQKKKQQLIFTAQEHVQTPLK